jgi:hypothetical protein
LACPSSLQIDEAFDHCIETVSSLLGQVSV